MSEIKPALTPEEWKSNGVRRRDLDGRYVGAVVGGIGGSQLVALGDGFFQEQSRHALGAIALHGQPFGFTWADVDRLQAMGEALYDDWDKDVALAADDFLDIADRIAALLPPRTTDSGTALDPTPPVV